MRIDKLIKQLLKRQEFLESIDYTQQTLGRLKELNLVILIVEQLSTNDSEYCTCRVRVEGLHYDFEGKPYCADCTKRLSKT